MNYDDCDRYVRRTFRLHAMARKRGKQTDRREYTHPSVLLLQISISADASAMIEGDHGIKKGGIVSQKQVMIDDPE